MDHSQGLAWPTSGVVETPRHEPQSEPVFRRQEIIPLCVKFNELPPPHLRWPIGAVDPRFDELQKLRDLGMPHLADSIADKFKIRSATPYVAENATFEPQEVGLCRSFNVILGYGQRDLLETILPRHVAEDVGTLGCVKEIGYDKIVMSIWRCRPIIDGEDWRPTSGTCPRPGRYTLEIESGQERGASDENVYVASLLRGGQHEATRVWTSRSGFNWSI